MIYYPLGSEILFISVLLDVRLLTSEQAHSLHVVLMFCLDTIITAVYFYVTAFTVHVLGGYRFHILPLYNAFFVFYLHVIDLGVNLLIDISRRLP